MCASKLNLDGLRKVRSGAACDVYIAGKADDVFQSATAEDRARTSAIMETLSTEGESSLNPKMFKHEGRYASGRSGKVAVYAVKGHQLRLYGGFVGKSPRTFVCVDAAIKKQDKADRDQLKRAARALGELES